MTREDILKSIEENDVRYIRMMFIMCCIVIWMWCSVIRVIVVDVLFVVVVVIEFTQRWFNYLFRRLFIAFVKYITAISSNSTVNVVCVVIT